MTTTTRTLHPFWKVAALLLGSLGLWWLATRRPALEELLAWDPEQTYQVGNRVSREGVTYEAIATSQGVDPGGTNPQRAQFWRSAAAEK